jgi:hypothetical protein
VIGKDAFGAGDLIDHIDEVQKDLDVQKAFALEGDGKYIEILDDKTRSKYSIAQRDEALNAYAQKYAQIYGVSIEEARSVATAKYKGMTYTNKQGTRSTIYIDDNHNNGALDTAHTMGHEVTHARINQGAARDRGSHRLNEEYADTMGDYSADGMEFSSRTYNGVTLDNSRPTYRKPRTKADITRLRTSTSQMNTNIQKAARGDGHADASIVKATVTGAKIANKIRKIKGKISKEKLKKIFKEEGKEIADDVLTLIDGELNIDDALAIVDLATGTNFNNKKAKVLKGKKKPELPNPKKKANSSKPGETVRTPDTADGDFARRTDGTYKNKKTGEIWSKSHTEHSGGPEWKVGLGKGKTPTKGKKITIRGGSGEDAGKIIKVDK